jgi:N-acetylneuraminic acid mutarotase
MQENLFTKQSLLSSIFFRLGLCLSLGILIVLLPIGLASGASPSLDPADPPSRQDPTIAFYGTPDQSGQDVVLDSAYASIFKPVSHSATVDIGWNALPNLGLNLRVRAIALAGDSLYIGGRFTETGDDSVTDLGRVTRYDIASSTWHALPNQGLNEEVTTLAVMDGDLYAGGGFTQTVDTVVSDLGYVAHYDSGVGTWNALSNQGLDDFIFALAVASDNLYIGGLFSQTGDGSVSNLGHIARYDTTTGIWHALSNQGLNGNVYMVATAGSDVYAGGGFSQTGDGAVANLGHIARYNTVSNTWHALSNQGLNDSVLTLAVVGNDLYVGGAFDQTADGSVSNLGHIARYDTAADTWQPLPNHGLNDSVFALAVAGTDLYVGGAFDQTEDGLVTNLGNIARYDTVSDTWQPLPNQGLNSWVYVLAPVDSDLYVAGEFSQVGDGVVPGLNHIARFGEFDSKLYLPLVIRQ